MCSGIIEDCHWCVRDDGDIRNALMYCSHCRRAYSNEDEREIHNDYYKDSREKEENNE